MADVEIPPWSTRDWGILAALAALTAFVYAQVASHQFLNYDDPQFVYANRAVLNFDVKWALTSTSNTWLPLTWISHMIDVRLFGLHAGPQILVNALLHLGSACLLFVALRDMTARVWPSAFVAALFAVHPAHVESVAWLAERKDVLSTFFAMLALVFRARGRKAWTAIAMALSLLAKQTYVTLPFVLLLLDYWPCGRLRRASDLRKLIAEKMPLFALSIVGAIAAFIGQRGIGGMKSLEESPISERLTIAFVGYVRYLGKFFFPSHLAVPYPPTEINRGIAFFAMLLLLAVTAVVFVYRKRAPWAVVGWLWFVGTLIPLVGFIQLGGAPLADRYTYFSFIGLSLIVAWGASELNVPRPALAAAGVAVIAVLAVLGFRQTSYWKNSETLFTHTIDVTPPNAIAEYSLGQNLQITDPDRAIEHLQRAIDLAGAVPEQYRSESTGWYPQAYLAMATALMTKARTMPPGSARTETLVVAIGVTRHALQIDPNIPAAKESLQIAAQMLQQDPRHRYDMYMNLGTSLSNDNRYDDAVAQFRKAVEIMPRSPEAHVYLALGLLQAKKKEEAIREFETAKSIDAAQANDFLTKALHWAPGPGNLDTFIAQLR